MLGFYQINDGDIFIGGKNIKDLTLKQIRNQIV